MKTKKNATLRKLGMILAVALLFSALAVPVWAEGEDGVGTAGAADAQPGGTVPADSADAAGSTADPQTAAQNDTTSVPDPTAPGTSEANPDTTAIQPRESEQGGNGGDNSGGNSNSGSEVTPPVEPNVPVAGDLYVTGYTVLNEIGGVELQRIEANQKCTIIVSVADTRFVNFVDEPAIREYLGTQNEAIANIKVTSTASFSPPSIDYIYTRSEEFKQEDRTLRYVIVLEGITYLGGENKLSLDIGYKKGALELKSVTQAISQCINAEETAGEPGKLVITSTSYGGGTIDAGKDFTLTVDVLASKGTADVENVQVSLSLPEHITVATGSSDIFIGDMKPNTSRQVSFLLTASAVTPSGSQNISVSVMSTTEGAEASKSIAVPITQPERFEISRTDLPEYLSMGEEGYASVSFVNKGKGTIYNVSAEIKGEGITTTEGNLYVGNVASGTESSADFTIQTSQSGTLSAVLTVTYEDEKGNVKELTKEFSMTVEEMNMGGDDMGFDPGFDPMPMPEEPQGMPVWGWILIGVGVLAVGGGAAFFIIKKKKAKKKAAQLTEDDDEDI